MEWADRERSTMSPAPFVYHTLIQVKVITILLLLTQVCFRAVLYLGSPAVVQTYTAVDNGEQLRLQSSQSDNSYYGSR